MTDHSTHARASMARERDRTSGKDEVEFTVYDPSLRRYLLRIAGGMPTEWLEDVLQDLAVELLDRGDRPPIQCQLAFARVFLRRRLIDALRRRRPQCEWAEPIALTDSADIGSTDWVVLLRDAGFDPTEGWIAILERISSGIRSTKGIARSLGRDRNSVRESRRRLHAWLQGIHESGSFGQPPRAATEHARRGRGVPARTTGPVR